MLYIVYINSRNITLVTQSNQRATHDVIVLSTTSILLVYLLLQYKTGDALGAPGHGGGLGKTQRWVGVEVGQGQVTQEAPAG